MAQEKVTKSRILIVGATGYTGKSIAKASAEMGHPTFVLVRPTSAKDPHKAQILESFKTLGIKFMNGSLENYESLVDAVKNVDVVISCVGVDSSQQESSDPSSYQDIKDVAAEPILKQINLINAIKQVGTIKRFMPSEFGFDVGEVGVPVGPTLGVTKAKLKVREAVESSGIPYTYVVCNGMAAFFLACLGQPGLASPPTDHIIIYGDGNAKVCTTIEEDIAKYTVLAADDERTLNKTLHMRPPLNTLSQNEMVALWEKKSNTSLTKTFMSEQQVIQKIEETRSLYLDIALEVFVRGVHTMFPVEKNGVEATALYPQVNYTTADEYLSKFT